MELMDRYQQAVFDLLFKARTTQRENIVKAGELVAHAVEGGGKETATDEELPGID